jgi:hypothetical protein
MNQAEAVANSQTSPPVPPSASDPPSSMTVRSPAIAWVLNSQLAIGCVHVGMTSRRIAAPEEHDEHQHEVVAHLDPLPDKRQASHHQRQADPTHDQRLAATYVSPGSASALLSRELRAAA